MRSLVNAHPESRAALRRRSLSFIWYLGWTAIFRMCPRCLPAPARQVFGESNLLLRCTISDSTYAIMVV
jgi:hypothetical protein